MTGLLCISALTNEHSNKGELKDQCEGVHAAGKRGNLQGEMKEGKRKTIEWKEGGGGAVKEALNNSRGIDLVTILAA